MITNDLKRVHSELKSRIIDMEFKNYFVMAFLRFVSSKDYKKYMSYKHQLLDTSSLEESAILIKKINYLETHGDVSAYLYLLNHCEDVKLYLELKSELDIIDLKMLQIEENDIYLNNDLKIVRVLS